MNVADVLANLLKPLYNMKNAFEGNCGRYRFQRAGRGCKPGSADSRSTSRAAGDEPEGQAPYSRILMKSLKASKASSNFGSAQGASAKSQQRCVELAATQRRVKIADATMR